MWGGTGYEGLARKLLRRHRRPGMALATDVLLVKR